MFQNSTAMKAFPYLRYRYFGFGDESNTSFVFMRLEKQPYPIDPMFYYNVSDHLLAYDDFVSDISDIQSDVYELAGNFSVKGEIFFVALRVNPGNASDEPFRLPVEVNGTAMTDKFTLRMKGFEFNLAEFIAEGKLCGVVSAAAIVVNFYAWSSLAQIRTVTGLTQVSFHSLMMHIAFDFSFGLFLLSIGMLYSFLVLLFMVLFSATVGIYFVLQWQTLWNVWRTTENLGDLQMPEIRRLCLKFFGQMMALMFAAMLIMIFMLDAPFLQLLYLHASFLPQIIWNAKRNEKKNGDSMFIILKTVERIIQLSYFYLYRHNVMGTYAPATAIFFMISDVLQMVLLLQQNKYGGAFFLPKRYRPTGFNYLDEPVAPGTACPICMGEIEADEPSMVTPCQHGFHRDCLERWMQEQMICPVCRATLPPVQQEPE